MHSETALALVTRKHVNRRELPQNRIEPASSASLKGDSFEFIPLLFPCYGGRSSPVRVEFNACSLAGERGFSAISHSCGFRMRRGER
jgi:hypothetical protein